MRINLRSDQLASYERDGFVVVEGVLGADQLGRWRSSVDEAVAACLEGAGLHNQGLEQDPTGYFTRVLTACVNLRDIDSGVREIVLDRDVARLAAELSGVSALRIWHDQALFKDPYGNPTSFHFDNPYWSFSTRNGVNAWVALDDATIANGCLWYLPGTHRTARFELVRIDINMGSVFTSYPEWATIEAAPAECPAGSVVFQNAMVAHGAGPNMTPRRRRAMTMKYMPTGSTFNGNIGDLYRDYLGSLQIGDELTNDAINPVVWDFDW